MSNASTTAKDQREEGGKQASKAASGSETRPVPTEPTATALVPFDREALEAWLHASQALLHGTRELNGEVAGFLQRRLEADAEIGRRMLENQADVLTLMRVQQEYALALGRDYLDEAARVGQMAADTARRVSEPLEGYARRLAAAGEGARPPA